MRINIPLQKMTNADMESLEELELIKRLTAPSHAVKIPEEQFVGYPLYKTDPRYGGHMLLFVNINLLESHLNYHPGNEDIFLFNDGIKVKPCIFVFGLEKRQKIEEKINSGTLCAEDFRAYNIPFNDLNLSFFTIRSGTPHYEITLPGLEQSPYFWVGESADLPLIKIDMKNYQVKVITTNL